MSILPIASLIIAVVELPLLYYLRRRYAATEPNGIWDADGFDQYSYDANGYDRVGKREWDHWQDHLGEEGLLNV